LHVAKDQNYSPAAKKSSSAAINSALQIHGLENIFDFKFMYPLTHLVFKVITFLNSFDITILYLYVNHFSSIQDWLLHLKNAPHHAVKARTLELENLESTLLFNPRNDYELLHQAGVSWGCFTGQRSEDMHRMHNQNCLIIPKPRSIKCVLEHKTKNDITGTGPLAGRSYVLPCTCIQDEDFERKFKKDVTYPCVSGCPYAVVMRYISECPNYFGSEKLSFWRALSARGQGNSRNLTKNPLGINQIKAFTANFNSCLPANLQWEGKCTGKTPRMTFTTLAVNSGVPDQITSAASKHRDPATLKGYVKVNDSTLSGAALGISSALKKSRSDNGETSAPSNSSFHTVPETLSLHGPSQSPTFQSFSSSSSSLPTQVFYGNVTIHNK
jgi:hypothetical protein